MPQIARPGPKQSNTWGNEKKCAGPPSSPPTKQTKPATSVRAASHNKAGLSPTEPRTGCNMFLLSSVCEGGKHYRVAHSARPVPNETQSQHVPTEFCV